MTTASKKAADFHAEVAVLVAAIAEFEKALEVLGTTPEVEAAVNAIKAQVKVVDKLVPKA